MVLCMDMNINKNKEILGFLTIGLLQGGARIGEVVTGFFTLCVFPCVSGNNVFIYYLGDQKFLNFKVKDSITATSQF